MKTLRYLAIRLFKKEPPPSTRLSFLVGVNQRQVQYWLSGRDPTPDHIIDLVEDQIEAVEEFDLQGSIQRLIDESDRAGIKRPILLHFLDEAVEKIKDQDNNP